MAVNSEIKVDRRGGDNYIRILDVIEVLREVIEDENDSAFIIRENVKHVINQLKEGANRK